MDIVFVDEGESNRALIAFSLYDYIARKKKKEFPAARIATTGKNKSLHLKGMKVLKEFGLSVCPCSRKDVEKIEDIKSSGKTRYIVLGQDNDKKKIKSIVHDNKVSYWPIDNPIKECKNEVKMRFFRRMRDQLWVEIENLVEEMLK